MSSIADARSLVLSSERSMCTWRSRGPDDQSRARSIRGRTQTMNIQRAIHPTIAFASVKARQQAAWAAGDYAVVGTTLQIVGESLCEAVDLRSDQRVLDVAAGNGNASLAAARRFAGVVSTACVEGLVGRGRERSPRRRARSVIPASRCGSSPLPGRQLRRCPL